MEILKFSSIRRAAMLLLVTLFTVQMAWAFDGGGTSESPYLIKTADDWATFATNVNNGTDADKYYKLSDSWNNSASAVTATVGTSDHPFTGTFDGNGKTLTVAISDATNQGTAPFRYISGGATIKNLTVEGSVTGTTHYAGLVGFSIGGTTENRNTITGCTVNVTVSGGSHNAGVVGHGTTSKLQIVNTVFGGTINSGSSYSGGLLGWGDTYLDVVLTNCLFKGTYTAGQVFHPLALKETSSTVTATSSDCYYTVAQSHSSASQYIPGVTGVLVYATVASTEIYKAINLFDGETYYDVCTVSGVESSYNKDGDDPISITPVVKNTEGTTLTLGTHYTATLNGNNVGEFPINISTKGDYALAITGTGGYTGTKTISISVFGAFDGAGTEGSPYILSSTADWVTFAQNVNAGTDADKYYKLSDTWDNSAFPVTTTVGTYDHPFVGHLDGNGKTMTVALDVTGRGGVAPFWFIGGATIDNLTVAGTINAYDRHTAGIVAFAKDGTTNTIENCTVTATLNISSDYAGGIIAHGLASTTTVKDCVFAGTFNGVGGNHANIGGIWGWNNEASPILVNCLENGTYNNISSMHPIGLQSNKGTVTNCYYVNTQIGSPDQVCTLSGASRVYTTVPDGEISQKLTLADNNTYYRVCTVSVSGVESSYELSASPSINPTVTIDDAPATYNTDYTTKLNGETITLPYNITAAGDYALAITGTGDYTGTKTINFYVLGELSGEGTSESPYVISSTADWEKFAQNVNSGTDTDKYYKLSDGWNNSAYAVTTTVGTSEHPFAGHFDGNGKTLTVALNSTATGSSQAEQGVAPFHYISGATIENLTVAGTIASASYHTAGIVGFAADASTNTIQNCTVTATLNISSNYAGGIIGHGNTAAVTISNCTFAGTINGVGGNRANIGGIWGWSTTGNPVLVNCLENGTYTNISSMHPMGLQSNIGTITNCYYVNTQIGSPANVCTLSGYYQVFASEPDNRIYKQLTSGTQTYYAACNISGVKSKYYATGSPIGVVCTVTGVDGTVLTKDTDYEVSFSPATVQAAGEYTMTITAKDGSDYTGSQGITFTVTEYDEITSSSTSWQDGGVYKVTSNVTISDRITVNGNVTLILKDGFTLTAKKGIELSSTETTSNSLTINGEGGNNTGTLVCTGGYQQAGIGAYRYGVLTINGGTVNATGNSGSAGIGGSKHNNWGRTITINGGIVNATGNDGGAGIGGGEGKSWGGGYGQCGDIIINGGQVTATGGGDNGPGIGSGYDTDLNMGEHLTISISGAEDFVHAIGGSNSYGINADDFTSITLDKDKELVALRVGVATTENIKGVRDLHLVPSTDALKADLSCAAITGIENSYYFTNADITITPVLTSATGTTLTEGTDYTTVLTHDSETATVVNTPGSYTYTFTGMGSYTGTQSVSFTVYIPTPTNLKQTAFAAEGATMTWSQETGNVTSWELQYSTVSDFSSDVTTVNDIAETSRELTGLAKETRYSARVRAVLGDYSSDWSSMVFFYTTGNEWLGFGETETTTSFPIGYGTYYSVTEQIYTKSEIGSANTITSIEFCNTSANFSRNIDIYMVHTDKSKFSSGSDWILPTESDKVFSGTVNFQGASTWTTITLDTPFSYNGSQNVAIIIDSNSKAGSTYYYFRRMAYSDYSCLDYNNSSNNPDPTVSVPEGYRNGYRSQIRLGFNNAVKLIDNAANAATIASVDGKERTVTLAGRTLYKDGKWNTICLPFDVTISGSPLDGATARTVTAASIEGKKLSLTFGDAVTTLTAGTPYIIKWASGSDLTETDLVFNGVTIDKTTHDFSSGEGDTKVSFMGTYDVMSFDATDYTTLLMTGANTLAYPGSGAGLGACRAYFKIGEGTTARQLTGFDINFGEATGISGVSEVNGIGDNSWYTIDGRKLDGKPTQRGVYVNNGNKVVIK